MEFKILHEIIDLQDDYNRLRFQEKLTKQNICNLVIPFRDKYQLSDKDALRIARNELSLKELVNLLESKEERSNTYTFLQDVLAGKTNIDCLDDYVETWEKSNRSLREFLGMTPFEYEIWEKIGNSILPNILYCRKQKLDFETYCREQELDFEAYCKKPELEFERYYTND